MIKRTCRLSADRKTLTITHGKKSVAYQIEDLHPDAELASYAFRLIKPDGKAYTVHFDKYGPSCDCEDMHYRKGKENSRCKHLLVMMQFGFIPADEIEITVPEGQEEF